MFSRLLLTSVAAALMLGGPPRSLAQAPAAQPIGRVAAPSEVRVSGAVDMHAGEMLLGNGSAITAGRQPVTIGLTRGGTLRLCATSGVHLSESRATADSASTGKNDGPLMMALGHGAIEASYTAGKDSDVLLTPDLRISISGPGQVDLKVRVNAKGDTCVDNHGANAPYVIVSSDFEDGLYRVQPGQRVSFQHGSLREVVDHEPEPCGCPPAPAVSVAGNAAPAKAGPPVGGPSSTPEDTAFPLAESEGLAAPPPPPDKPVVPAGTPHVEVSVPLVFHGEHPPQPPPPAPANTALLENAAPAPVQAAQAAQPPAAATTAPSVTSEPVTAEIAPLTKSAPRRGFFRSIGHFFAKIFGG